MKYDIALLVELVGAALARHPGTPAGLALAVHDAHRTLPLLEAAGATAYVNLRAAPQHDFRPVQGGLPATKERLSLRADPEGASDLMARATLALVCVPDDADALSALPLPDSARCRCLYYGDARAAGWAKLLPRLRMADFTPIDLGGERLLITRDAVTQLGGRRRLLPPGIGELAGYVAQQIPHALAVESHGAGLRLRIKPDPLQLIVAGSESLTYNLTHEGRALFNSRGIGGITLPLDGRGSLQLLVRNVRDRIDNLTIAVGARTVPLNRIDYTEYGAVLSLPPTRIEAGRDALMYIALPRSAVPSDGFCDIGAVTQTLELA